MTTMMMRSEEDQPIEMMEGGGNDEANRTTTAVITPASNNNDDIVNPPGNGHRNNNNSSFCSHLVPFGIMDRQRKRSGGSTTSSTSSMIRNNNPFRNNGTPRTVPLSMDGIGNEDDPPTHAVRLSRKNSKEISPEEDEQKQRLQQRRRHYCCYDFGISHFFIHNRWIQILLIVVLGSAIFIAFLILGIQNEYETSATYFTQSSTDLTNSIVSAWREYEVYSLWAHQACFSDTNVRQSIYFPASGVGNDTTIDDLENGQDNQHDLDSFFQQDRMEMCSHEQFRNLYEKILSLGLDVFSLQFATRLEDRYREAYESDSRAYYAEHYPNITYQGITKRDNTSKTGISLQGYKPFYYPIGRLEPIEQNKEVIDMDVYESSGPIIDYVLKVWEPLLSGRVKLLQDDDPDTWSVYLVHPGQNTSFITKPPNSFVATIIRIPDMLRKAAQGSLTNKVVYLFDSSIEEVQIDVDGTEKIVKLEDDPTFLGGVEIYVDWESDHEGNNVQEVQAYALPDVNYSEVVMQGGGGPTRRRFSNSGYFQQEMTVMNRNWTVICVTVDDSHSSSLVFVYIGGIIILLAFGLLVWISYIRSRAEDVKTFMAQKQIQRERHLNQYLAHEVRNPLSSAMSALSFVSTTTKEHIHNEETQRLLMNDISVAESSLNFINDLLRNMLDINKAANREIKIQFGATDVLRDILEPVAGILYMRGVRVDILTECTPTDLVVMTDRLRLKQMLLNLATNATKFVVQGFIRLRAVVNEHSSVVLYVEDTGPGLPVEKQLHLFKAFQESLDLLNQGTGIGLYICRELADLMGATLSLDTSYNSEVPGCPGARFVIDLQKRPESGSISSKRSLDPSSSSSHDKESSSSNTSNDPTESINTMQSDPHPLNDPAANATTSVPVKDDKVPNKKTESDVVECISLPEEIKVLFVDDDTVLRKLFIRSIRRVAPSWIVEEAANGEAALQLVERTTYDIIFMDNYMPGSIERPLLGTETVRNLRIKGVTGIICGLSANDMDKEFIEAGADCFMLKPLPCKTDILQSELSELFRKKNKIKKEISSDK